MRVSGKASLTRGHLSKDMRVEPSVYWGKIKYTCPDIGQAYCIQRTTRNYCGWSGVSEWSGVRLKIEEVSSEWVIWGGVARSCRE